MLVLNERNGTTSAAFLTNLGSDSTQVYIDFKFQFEILTKRKRKILFSLTLSPPVQKRPCRCTLILQRNLRETVGIVLSFVLHHLSKTYIDPSSVKM